MSVTVSRREHDDLGLASPSFDGNPLLLILRSYAVTASRGRPFASRDRIGGVLYGGERQG